MSRERPNPRNEKPISLHPMTLEDALKKAMSAKPPKYEDKESTDASIAEHQDEDEERR